LDNLCHTLTGAAFAEAGLKRWTRFGSVALMIAANLPDIDVLAFATDTPSVAIRRGWTHGVLAQALLPLLLTGVFVGIDRWRPPRSPDRARVDPLPMLALCYAAVLSHVGMDWLNNYGVRLLMPFSNQWFYGDAVFIVDPWLWLMLGAGFVLARRHKRTAPARKAILMATFYVACMIGSALAARAVVRGAWSLERGRGLNALMVGPLPANPLGKAIIVDEGTSYWRGTFRWLPLRVEFDEPAVPKNDQHPAVARARDEPHFRALLVWARFPYYEVTPIDGGTRVTLRDMRFGDRGLFTVTTVVR
jgi:inner membrane protein